VHAQGNIIGQGLGCCDSGRNGFTWVNFEGRRCCYWYYMCCCVGVTCIIDGSSVLVVALAELGQGVIVVTPSLFIMTWKAALQSKISCWMAARLVGVVVSVNVIVLISIVVIVGVVIIVVIIAVINIGIGMFGGISQAWLVVSGYVGTPKENLGLNGDSVAFCIIIINIIVIVGSCCVLIRLSLELCSGFIQSWNEGREEGFPLCIDDIDLATNGNEINRQPLIMVVAADVGCMH